MEDIYQRLKPLRRVLNMRHEGWTVWDCSPIYGPDGCVHVFATRWQSVDRPDATWYMGSQIVHAVAAKPEGPCEVLGVVIEGDGGSERWDSSGVINAKVYAVGDQFCLPLTDLSGQSPAGDTQVRKPSWEGASDWRSPTCCLQTEDRHICSTPWERAPKTMFTADSCSQ